jgi:ADP-ribose pyrophosphatase YjhB (NUDIX family)
MASAATPFDYHGALVVLETDGGEIVFIHPPGGPPEAPASLPSNPCNAGEVPEEAAVRMVREMTGLEATIVREFVKFIQEGTPDRHDVRARLRRPCHRRRTAGRRPGRPSTGVPA